MSRLALAGLGIPLAVALLVGLEGVLRLVDAGSAIRSHDPFAGFSNLVPMFEPAVRPDGVRVLRTAAARGAPVPAEFLAEKPAGGFRVFVVGGSSSAGTPYDYRYAFGGWLERRLRSALPDLHVEVVNAALGTYATRRTLAIVEEIAEYEPDLLIVYSGHNEIAESRYYKHLLELHPALFKLWTGIAATRSYRVLTAWSPLARTTEWFRAEPLTFGDRRNWLEFFSNVHERSRDGTDPEREMAYREIHYRHNLEAMVDVMHALDAKVLLATLSQNFSDWPPGGSSHRSDLRKQERARWDHLVSEGDARRTGDGGCALALASYRAALAIDESHADLHFRIANCERNLGRSQKAFEHYRLANDLDTIPAGAPTRYNEIVRDLAYEKKALLVDVERLFTHASPGGLVGNNWFTDLAHPNLAANQLIAGAIEDILHEQGIPLDPEHWNRAAYVDTPVEAIYAREPELRVREGEVRAAACMLSGRKTCALAEARAVLEADPHNEMALHVLRSVVALNDE